MSITAQEIHDKAIELGFIACGIVKADAMRGYEEKLNSRIERFPETKPYYSYLNKFCTPKEIEPHAKSIIVCVGRYGKYNIPAHLQGRIGKLYLTDYRTIPESKEYQAAAAFDTYLPEHGVQFKRDINGISAGRYAAVQAGLGIIRKNNFLYTEYGSWIWLETWLIDQELEFICQTNLQPCPPECTSCIDACATHALAEPYQINPFRCTSMLTWGGLPNTLPREDLRIGMKGWIYGCDDCQDCCPMNKNCWTSEEHFPRIDELQKYLSLEQLLTLDDETIADKLSPLFWYIGRHNVWKWKVQALRAMAYKYEPKYLPTILQACDDENPLIREMAQWAYHMVQDKDH